MLTKITYLTANSQQHYKHKTQVSSAAHTHQRRLEQEWGQSLGRATNIVMTIIMALFLMSMMTILNEDDDYIL